MTGGDQSPEPDTSSGVEVRFLEVPGLRPTLQDPTACLGLFPSDREVPLLVTQVVLTRSRRSEA